MFYVYEHLRQDTNAVFYVGKGSGARCKTSQGRNKWWHCIVNKHGYSVKIKLETQCEELALFAEQEMIDKYRRIDVPLVNVTDGGDGISGYKFSSEVLAKRSLAQTGQKRPTVSKKLKGIPKSAEHIAKLSASRIGLKMSEEVKKRLSEQRKGKPSAMLGKKHREESKRKISNATRGEKNPFYGKTHTLETIEKILAANVGRKDSEETRLKKSLARRGQNNPSYGKRVSQEQIDRQRATLMARPKVTCPHCQKVLDESNAKRWHFDNCKQKVA